MSDTAMDDATFDRAVVKAVFAHAGLRGWADTRLVEAAQDAGLDLHRLRGRFPGREAVLLRFGVHADQAALAGTATVGSPRERLFDILMYRFEALQEHRDGVIALLNALPTDPRTSMLLYGTTLRSMRWLLEGAGIPTTGVTGMLRVHGLLALWLYALRAWKNDDSAELSGTMRAVDSGLDRAMQAERSLPGGVPAGEAPAGDFEQPPEPEVVEPIVVLPGPESPPIVV